jgi:hypothetical protein
MPTCWLEPTISKHIDVIDAESPWEQGRLIDRGMLLAEARDVSLPENHQRFFTTVTGASHEQRGGG